MQYEKRMVFQGSGAIENKSNRSFEWSAQLILSLSVPGSGQCSVKTHARILGL